MVRLKKNVTTHGRQTLDPPAEEEALSLLPTAPLAGQRKRLNTPGASGPHATAERPSAFAVGPTPSQRKRRHFEQCPLWVTSRPFSTAVRMSAFGGKADVNHCVGECPLLAISGHSNPSPPCPLVDDLARLRHHQPHRRTSHGESQLKPPLSFTVPLSRRAQTGLGATLCILAAVLVMLRPQWLSLPLALLSAGIFIVGSVPGLLYLGSRAHRAIPFLPLVGLPEISAFVMLGAASA